MYATSVTIEPLGVSAVSVSFGNRIDPELHRQVMHLYDRLQQNPFPGLADLAPAYASLGIYFNYAGLQQTLPPGADVIEFLRAHIQAQLDAPPLEQANTRRHWEIPVCYAPAYGPDLEALSRARGISPEELVRLHTGAVYTVFMTGFRPGFPYMGIVPDALQTPRKATPRLRVPAGSVGIAGAQTGIYPAEGPGGWQIIGRTPWRIFDSERQPPVLLQAGDTVQFIATDDSVFTI